MRMKIVGDHLAEVAMSESVMDRKDLFARSAFNRYYYATFLSARSMLARFDSAWERTPHSNLPDLLENTLPGRIRSRADKAAKNGAISHSQKMAVISRAIQSARELAQLLKQALMVRITADYRPDEYIVSGSADISLANCTLASAKGWCKRAEFHVSILLRLGADVYAI